MSTKPYKQIERFMVAHIVDVVRTGDTFESWPRHMTLHPWFRTFPATAIDRFMTAVRIIERYPVDRSPYKLGEVAIFGPQGENRARPVAARSSLGFIHGVLVAQFDGLDADPTYMGGGYNPHESEVEGTDYENLDVRTFVVDSLCLIRRDPEHKIIVCAEKF